MTGKMNHYGKRIRSKIYNIIFNLTGLNIPYIPNLKKTRSVKKTLQVTT